VNVRLCKGAYREPPGIAYPRKRDVDASFLRLAARLLSPDSLARGTFAAFATHDPRMVAGVQRLAAERSVPRDRFEFQMLYGIGRDLQAALVAAGTAVRIYIPYGDAWFPYFMRRLAERPANLLFLLRSLLRG
jgi:proline dehydrogenase